jgi:hypothetical protein
MIDVVSLDSERVKRKSTHLGSVTVEVYMSPQGRPYSGGLTWAAHDPENGDVFRRSVRPALLHAANVVRDANDEDGIPKGCELGINLKPFKEQS